MQALVAAALVALREAGQSREVRAPLRAVAHRAEHAEQVEPVQQRPDQLLGGEVRREGAQAVELFEEGAAFFVALRGLAQKRVKCPRFFVRSLCRAVGFMQLNFRECYAVSCPGERFHPQSGCEVQIHPADIRRVFKCIAYTADIIPKIFYAIRFVIYQPNRFCQSVFCLLYP